MTAHFSESPKKFIALMMAISLLGGGVGGALTLKALIHQNAAGGPVTITGTREVVREESAVISVVNTVSPAVVSVVIYKKVGSFFNRTGPFFFDFGNREQLPPHDNAPQAVGGGSGFVVQEDGLIVTNRHVVEDKDATYKVILADGREFDAEVKAIDPILDFALLKINAEKLPTVKFGDSDAVQIGESVVAIGNVLSEFANSVTAGIISGINRRVVAGNGENSEVLEEALQTDAAINPGNSGGPLVDLRGEVIGINTAVSQEGQSLGFAIPVNTIKPLLASFREQGRIVRPWLGVRYVMLNAAISDQEKLSVKEGAFVAKGTRGEPGVVADSPAAKGGLKERDVITAVNGRTLDEKLTLGSTIATFKPGDEVALRVIREGKELTLKIKLGEFGK